MSATPVLKTPEALKKKEKDEDILDTPGSDLSAVEKLKAQIWLCQEELSFAVKVTIPCLLAMDRDMAFRATKMGQSVLT